MRLSTGIAISRGGARFSARPAHRRGSPSHHRPGSIAARRTWRRTVRPGRLTREVSARSRSLQHMSAAPFRPGGAASRTIPLRRLPNPSGTRADGSVRPCGFRRLASRMSALRDFGDAALVGLLSRPGRGARAPRQRSWDSLTLRSVDPIRSGERPRRARRDCPHPRAVSPLARREFHRRGAPPVTACRGVRGRGSWGLAPRTSRTGMTCRSR